MAAPATNEEFLDLVRKSGVTDEKRFEPHVQRLRQTGAFPADASKLAGVLVRDGYLTRFQAEQILQGKWKRFTIGKYKVLERLGSGGMGSVYLCEHKLMRRRVAVKVLPTAKAKDPSALERFYREARAVAALDHPNIVHAYDIDQDEALHFLVMEYVDGSNFQDIVKKSGPMNLLRACHYIRQAAQGLDHANQAGLVHRDIKPANILVDRTGVVKILDMGLARFFNDEEDDLTKKYDENVLGTADYLAPEQAHDSHDVDIRADIYSLGATFYFLLTGKTAFGEGTVAQKLIWHQTRHPKPIQEVRPDVPPGLAGIINKMMAKDKNHRYQLPAQIAEALGLFTQTPIAPPPVAEMPHLSPAATGGVHADTTPETVVRSGATGTPIRPAATPRPAPSFPPPPPGRTPQPRGAPPVAQPIQPAMVATAVPPPQPGEDVHWEDLEGDTQNALAGVDTTPQRKRRRNVTEEVFKTQKKRVWLVVGIAAIPILIIVIVGLIFFSNYIRPIHDLGPGAKDPPKREKLMVRKGATKTDTVFPTLLEALQDARNGEIIEIQDDILEENVVVDEAVLRKTLASDLTLQAAIGKKVLWKSGVADPGVPLLLLNNAQGLRLIGRGITFDGSLSKGVVKDLVRIHFRAPGLTILDAEFQNFSRAALYIANAQGTEKSPLRVSGIRVAAPKKTGPEEPFAVLMEGDEDVKGSLNAHIRIEENCHFSGFTGPAISVQSSAIGKNVDYPKK